ncbi:NUDIX hydrolase [Nocardiopsis sp. LOL_012]|uniref:NUDIX hydrolase n=1 Tax=Nocardiopsis sp. LOL_012 TaxID=3345409 RepID=UPI003A8B3DF2
MDRIVRQSARGLIFDSARRLVLIKRTKPGREPYWVAVGGGLEPGDTSVESALHREVAEEIGGGIARVHPVLLITDHLSDGIGLQHVFAARLMSMSLESRTGPEFAEPGRGIYEVVRVPATREAVSELRLLPSQLADFVRANVNGLLALLDREDPDS